MCFLFKKGANNGGESNIQSSTMVATIRPEAIKYNLVEQGKYGQKSFLRYAAVDAATDNSISVKMWAELMSTTDQSHHAKGISKIIQDSNFKAVFFETKGVSSSNFDQKQFEFVLLNAPSLYSFAESRPDPAAFEEHMEDCRCGGDTGCQFANLGGDAMLIAPCQLPFIEDRVYSHLAAFVANAPDTQVAEVWKRASTAYYTMLQTRQPADKPVWFSTSGTGIAWLHFRLDDRPKYYQYRPFADEE